MNEHDSEQMAAMLESEGLVPTASVDDADLVLFNTCCIRENADQRLYGQLGQLASQKKKRPAMQIGVGGCLAQKDGSLIAEKAKHVDIVFGTHNMDRLPALLLEAEQGNAPIVEVPDERETLPAFVPAKRQSPFQSWVTISIGCNNSCTFCIVPSVRGPEVSRRMGDIVSEVATLADEGVLEITLLGQNVNSYGRDLDGRRPLFAELLCRLDKIDGISRIRFTSPHPKDIRPETIEAMASCESVCDQLHLPLQSGSDRILSQMHRGYTASRFLRRVSEVRNAIPDITLSTDIIVGFPGETEEDFAATLSLVEEVQFDSAYTFIYSPRPGTAAADMHDPVPDVEKKERYQRLSELQNGISWSRNLQRVGKTKQILIEGPSKKNPDRLSGRTEGGILCHVPRTPALSAGNLVEARVTGAAPHYLLGLVE